MYFFAKRQFWASGLVFKRELLCLMRGFCIFIRGDGSSSGETDARFRDGFCGCARSWKYIFHGREKRDLKWKKERRRLLKKRSLERGDVDPTEIYEKVTARKNPISCSFVEPRVIFQRIFFFWIFICWVQSGHEFVLWLNDKLKIERDSVIRLIRVTFQRFLLDRAARTTQTKSDLRNQFVMIFFERILGSIRLLSTHRFQPLDNRIGHYNWKS